MKMHFFHVDDNSFNTRGFPWASIIVSGLQNRGKCSECGAILIEPIGDIEVLLERNKGNKWPDVLGCGSEPLFILSRRVIVAWESEGLGKYPMHKVTIRSPLPKKLEGTIPPEYFWLDGGKMLGAKVDFEESGYVDVKFCGKCGRRNNDISATYDRQHSSIYPHVFISGSWNGMNVFTTDLSPAYFFCTEQVIDCAKKYKFTNFNFVPIERSASSFKGIKYL